MASPFTEIESPGERLSRLIAFLGTTASMIAVINNVVAGVGVALWVQAVRPGRWLGIGIGVAVALALTAAFLAYQRWRFAPFVDAGPIRDEP